MRVSKSTQPIDLLGRRLDLQRRPFAGRSGSVIIGQAAPDGVVRVDGIFLDGSNFFPSAIAAGLGGRVGQHRRHRAKVS